MVIRKPPCVDDFSAGFLEGVGKSTGAPEGSESNHPATRQDLRPQPPFSRHMDAARANPGNENLKSRRNAVDHAFNFLRHWTPIGRRFGDHDSIGPRERGHRLPEAPQGGKMATAPRITGIDQHEIEVPLEPEMLKPIVKQHHVGTQALSLGPAAGAVRIDDHRHTREAACHLQRLVTDLGGSLSGSRSDHDHLPVIEPPVTAS